MAPRKDVTKPIAIEPETAPVVEQSAPETTPEVAPIAGTLAVTEQNTATESTAAPILAEAAGNDKPLEVPATPVPPTPAQLAAKLFRTEIDKAWSMFYGQRPISGGAAFVEPDAAAIKALRAEYIVANNIDATDLDALMEVGIAVKEQIDAQRAAFKAAAADQSLVDREWLRASLSEISALQANVNQLLIAAGGTKQETKKAAGDDSAPSTARSTINWKEIAPKLIDTAERLGLAGFYFVDSTVGGYKGAQRPVRLHRDGRWEVCTWVDENTIPTGTGRFVDSWKYYDTNGNDWTGAEGQKKPAHALSKDEMYGVFTITADKGQIRLNDLNHARYDDKGQMVPGTQKHYIMPTVFWTEAGLKLGSK